MVINDPNRVFGDDAPVFAPLAFVGALGLSTSASLVTSYGDNVARIAEDEELPSRFRSKDDVIFRPTLGLALERPIGQHRLFASGTIGRTFFVSNSQLNANRLNLAGGANLQLGRSCSGQLLAAYSRRDTQLGSFEEVVAATSTRTSFGGNVSCFTLTGLTGSLGYNRSQARNRSDQPGVDRSISDANGEVLTGNIGYRVGQRGQVGISGSLSENRFPNQIVDGIENGNTIKTYSIYGSYRIGNRLSTNASIGKTDLVSTIPGSVGFNGTVWSVALGYSGPRLGANIGTGQSVNAGNAGNANYAITRFVNGSVTYRVNERLSTAAGYAYGQSDFRGIDQIPETEPVASNVNHNLFFGADYRLNSMIRFALDLNHQRRVADPAEFGFKANTISFTVAARF